MAPPLQAKPPTQFGHMRYDGPDGRVDESKKITLLARILFTWCAVHDNSINSVLHNLPKGSTRYHWNISTTSIPYNKYLT